jgi:uncharacterized protein (TIGR04222 family)
MTNPLDLHGPEFLVFYFVVGSLTLLLAKYIMKQQESQGRLPALNLTDPYEIAMLRGGEDEAMRIAALSLIDRGLIEVTGETIKTKSKASIGNVRRAIEKAILSKFSEAAEAHEMYEDDNLKTACAEYRSSLVQHRLLTDVSIYEARRPILWLGALILGGLAVAKIFVAFQRGHFNVLFLVGLAAVFLFYLFGLYNKERTGLGDRVLTDLKSLFKDLNNRGFSIKPGGETNEAALLAAVFGVSALSASSFPYIKNLFPKASKNTNSFDSFSFGSSCGSSCSGGTSCGGSSGCGGGGGCGGCGGGD